MFVLNENSVDPDQAPRVAASDLGLDCSPISILCDARHKWINARSKNFVLSRIKIIDNYAGEAFIRAPFSVEFA